MSDEEDSIVNLRFCSCMNRRLLPSENNPLFLAVHNDDLPRLKRYLKGGENVNARNLQGYPLLTYTIQHKRTEIFDYLLTVENLDIDALDNTGQSPLLNAFTLFDEYFALELIKKGADVHLRDDKGFTLLHLGAWKTSEDTTKVGRVVIEKGVDIDATNIYGETALYVACHGGNTHWIHMLLYYGADPGIPSDVGILPVAMLAGYFPEEERVLFDSTFDGLVDVRLPTLVQAMKRGDNLFVEILSSTADVTYDYCDLKFFDKHLLALKASHFRLFVRKFGHIVRDLVVNFNPLSRLVELGALTRSPEQKGMIRAFLESDSIADFVQKSDFACPTIAKLVQMFNKPEEEAEVTEIACLLLSYGLEVSSFDLDVVYSYFGFCELFRVLLHMDIRLVSRDKCVMSALYYDFSSESETLLDRISLSPCIFSYYNLPKLKMRCKGRQINKEIAAKVDSLPPLPLLVELSRNAARNFIVDRFKVEKSRRFYTILNRLPIDKTTKSILELEKPLY